ncbi:MAG TPA: TonB family protein, partial [Kofleriaceae bacterium]|nr:TonB family protein [Kofleriaceae bacterium]
MRRWLLIALVGCSHPAATPPSTVPAPTVQRLRAPPALDPDVRGSAYLATVALQLQPGWGQFLDDCRLRLPATHALNEFSLAATADLAIDPRGQVVDVRIASSGNADFDRAVRDALRDISPLPSPPRELWSDDDRVHLTWLFARDRRQAGPATAAVVDVELPLAGVVSRLVRERDLSRAARRILRAPSGDDRDAATRELAIAALREAVDASDTTVRRAAVEAIRRAGVSELAPDVRALLVATGDSELRALATTTLAALHDEQSAAAILELLARDIVENESLARTDVNALLALNHERDVVALLRAALANQGRAEPNAIALAVAGLVAMPEVSAQIGTWLASKHARTRAAACEALGSFAPADAKKWLVKGMSDRDASVRAACTRSVRDPASVRAKLRALAKDRDIATRAAAVAHLARLPDEVVSVDDDPASQVRAAYAAAVTPTHDLSALLADRDPDVRAAAWQTHARGGAPTLKAEAADAADDPSPFVRRALIAALDDDETISRLARADVDGDVRRDALVRWAERRGRASVADSLLTN